MYGCRFVQTFGVLTKAEYSKLTGKDPGQISKVLNPVSWAWTNPSTAATYYLIDLTDLPSGLAQGIQRVEVFSEQLTSLEELFLSADCQITKNQGRHVFTSILSSSMAKRPTELHPGARKPMTLEELKAKHEQAEAETPLPADSAAAASSAGLDLPAEHHAVGIDLDAVQGVKNKTRRRKKAPADLQGSATPPPSAPATPAAGAAPPGAAAAAPPTPPPAAPPSSGGKVSAKQRQLAVLDSEMKKVAERHLFVQPNASVKCLESLSGETFLLKPENARQNSNNVNGAGPATCYCYNR